MKGYLSHIAALSLAGATLPAASTDTATEVTASATAFQNPTKQIDFSTKINWGTSGANKALSSYDSNKLGSDGLYYTRSGEISLAVPPIPATTKCAWATRPQTCRPATCKLT